MEFLVCYLEQNVLANLEKSYVRSTRNEKVVKTVDHEQNTQKPVQ